MATRVAMSATDLAEDTWTSGPANSMASSQYTSVAERTFVTWGCCVTQKSSGTATLPHLLWVDIGSLPMIDQRNALDYSLALTSVAVPYLTGEGGALDTFTVQNVGS